MADESAGRGDQEDDAMPDPHEPSGAELAARAKQRLQNESRVYAERLSEQINRLLRDAL